MDHFGGRVGAQKDPSSAKWPSPARWGPGSLRGYTVVVGPDGTESGEAGYGLQGDHQDLKTKKRRVRGCQASGCGATGCADTHPHPAPAVGCGTQAQPLAASAD